VKRVSAVILGGGRGTRLFPLTLERAKPAVSFAGKYRLIDIPISNCINSGIERVFVLTQFMSASLHRHIMQTYNFDTFSDGFVDILAAEQTPQSSDWFQGTADAVRATLSHTTYYRPEQVVILSGDHLYRMDYGDLVRYHREKQAAITLGVYPVSREEAPRMGLLRVNEQGEVLEFVEKPDDPAVLDNFKAPPAFFKARGLEIRDDRYLASMGIYTFDTDVLREDLEDRERTDFGHDVIPAAVGRRKLMAYPFAGHWEDIGTIDAFFEANISLAQPRPPFALYHAGWPIYTRTRSLPPSRIIGSEIRDSLVVEGSDISGAVISDSIVGVRSNIREGSRLDHVVMNGSDFFEGEEMAGPRRGGADQDPILGIGRYCVIERAIIDKNARIGDGVVIKAQPRDREVREDHYWIRDGITIIQRSAVIPSGTEI